ncbi:MAG: hypothetical protein ABIH26_06235 [Candidatus Eisenbacteria bacterium]
MRRQLLRPVLWLSVLLAVGIVESLRGLLRIVARLGFKSVATLAVLAVLWRSSDLLAAQLPFDAVRPLGHGIAHWVAAAATGAVVLRGLRSRLRRRLWSRLAGRMRLAR